MNFSLLYPSLTLDAYCFAAPTPAVAGQALSPFSGGNQQIFRSSSQLRETSWSFDLGSGNDAKPEFVFISDLARMTQQTPEIATHAEFLRANSEYLTHADSADFSPTSSFYVCGFFYISSALAGVDVGLVSKASGASNLSFTLRKNPSDTILLSVTSDGTTGTIVNVASSAITLDAWNFVAATFDDSANLIKVSINGGDWTTSSYTSAVFDSNTTFDLGRRFATNYLTGGMKRWAFAKEAMTDAMLAFYYNSGRGVPYSALPSDYLTNLKGFWELNETSGNRADSHSTANHLTDTNTVTSDESGGTTITITGSASSSFTSPETYTANLDATSGEGDGIAHRDYYAEPSFSSEYRYWKITISSPLPVYHNIGKIILGSAFNFNKDPELPVSVKISQDMPQRAAGQKLQIKMRGVSNDDYFDFAEKIANKNNLIMSVLYPLEDYTGVIAGKSWLKCRLSDFAMRNITAETCEISMNCEEII